MEAGIALADLTGQVTFTEEEIAGFPQGPQGDPGPQGEPGPPGSGGGGYLAGQLVRYVDFRYGLDTNQGTSPGSAKKTIQAAYNDLKATAESNSTSEGGRLGAGTIHLLPGDHDVGSGLSIAWNRPVSLMGARSGPRDHGVQNSASRIVSSGNPTELVRIQGQFASEITRGVSFEDIGFRMNHAVNTSLQRVIYAKRVGYLTVERCSFTNADLNTNVPVVAVWHEDSTTSDGEGGWCRIINNSVSRMALYRATAGGVQGGNFNRGRISDNVVFYGGTLPMVQLTANTNGYLVDGNNLEGTATAVEVGPSGVFTQNTFLNNSGEDPSSGTPPNPFYKFSGSVSQQLVIGGTCSSPSNGGYGLWASFGPTAYRNTMLGVFDLTDVSKSFKRKVVETTHADRNTLIPMNVPIPSYAVSGVSVDRGYDVATVTLPELANVVGTLVSDLRARGWVK